MFLVRVECATSLIITGHDEIIVIELAELLSVPVCFFHEP